MNTKGAMARIKNKKHFLCMHVASTCRKTDIKISTTKHYKLFSQRKEKKKDIWSNVLACEIRHGKPVYPKDIWVYERKMRETGCQHALLDGFEYREVAEGQGVWCTGPSLEVGR